MALASCQQVQHDTPALIARCLSGDRGAWDTLVDRYGRLVYSIPRGHGLCESDADDVFQNVFALLHRRLATIRDPMRLSAWLVTTARRETWRLQRERRGLRALNDGCSDPSAAAPALAAQREQQQLIREALRRLTPREQALITALFFEPQQDYTVVANRLGMRIGSIGPTRARCFRKLEKVLMQMGFTEAGPLSDRSRRARGIRGARGSDVSPMALSVN